VSNLARRHRYPQRAGNLVAPIKTRYCGYPRRFGAGGCPAEGILAPNSVGVRIRDGETGARVAAAASGLVVGLSSCRARSAASWACRVPE
jgi:hypothetical protein